MRFILILFFLIGCKETVVVNNCMQDKTIKWQYPVMPHKVGFKIYTGQKYPDKLLATIPLSQTPQREYTSRFDMCTSNYISITAFDDFGNESAFSKITCIGTGCKPMEYNKTQESSKFPPPGLVLE